MYKRQEPPAEHEAARELGWRLGALASWSGKLLGSLACFGLARALGLGAWIEARVLAPFAFARGLRAAFADAPVATALALRAAYLPIALQNFGAAAMPLGLATFALSEAVVGAAYSLAWAFVGARCAALADVASGGGAAGARVADGALAAGAASVALLLAGGAWHTRRLLADLELREAAAAAAGGPSAPRPAAPSK